MGKVEFENQANFNVKLESTTNIEVDIEDSETLNVEFEGLEEAGTVEVSSTKQSFNVETETTIVTTDPNWDYNKLHNKPQINGVELKGNKSFGDLGLSAMDEIDILSILD